MNLGIVEQEPTVSLLQLQIMENPRTDLPVCGSIGKAAPGNVSIGFGLPGGPNCVGCLHKGKDCYSERGVQRPDRAELLAKLARHEALGAAWVANKAAAELLARKTKPSWIRLSADGSVPQAPTPRERTAFIRLDKAIGSLGMRAHLPVENPTKAKRYRSFLRNIIVRESAQTLEQFLSADGLVSFVVGTRDMSGRERVRIAKALARARTSVTGRKCVVCPAVAVGYLRGRTFKNHKAKCGYCDACVRDCDVIYPLH